MRETPAFVEQDSMAEASKSTVLDASILNTQEVSVLTNKADELDHGHMVA